MSNPLFKFGVIADIQYCDIDNGTNYTKTETRFFRGTLAAAVRAVEWWSTHTLTFVAELGDVIDGQNAGKYGAGSDMKTPQTAVAYAQVMAEFAKVPAPFAHAIGNHELYNFTVAELQPHLARCESLPGFSLPPQEEDKKNGAPFGYYSFSPGPGWRVVVLNMYQESVLLETDHPSHPIAADLLARNNPNKLDGSENFFEGLSGAQMRFVPFNGSTGDKQLAWLQQTLLECRANHERVIVLSHVPVFVGAASYREIAWNFQEVLNVMHAVGGVVAYFAGHTHSGGYAQDSAGIHHVTMESSLIYADAAAVVEAFDDRLEVQGFGATPSRTLQF